MGFLVLSLLFFLAARSPWIKKLLTEYYIPALVYLSSKVMTLLGVGHGITANTFTSGTETFSVSHSCTGILVFLMLSAAVLSFPVSWKSRIQGVFTGFFVIFLLNTLRIIIIVTASGKFSQTFWFLHIIAGQTLIIAGTVAYFIFWLNFMTSKDILADMLLRQKRFQTVVLFTAGYTAGLFFYDLFLKSGIGEFTTDCIQQHAAAIIKMIRSGLSSQLGTGTAPEIVFNSGCLSSPVVVLLIALVVCMPWHWATKAVVLMIGFLPVFYGYHLVRAVLTDISFVFGKSRSSSVIYNCWGQFFLTGLGILLFRYYEYRKGKTNGFPTVKRTLTGVAAGITAASAGGILFVKGIMPIIVSVLHPSDTSFYNFQLTITTMPYFQLFILFFLVWSDTARTAPKTIHSLIGSLTLFGFMVVLTGVIEWFGLSPHIGILKFIVVVFPFAVCWYLNRYKQD